MSNLGVTCITCTGGRPEAFELLQEAVLLQGGAFEWIIVNDSEEPLNLSYAAAIALSPIVIKPDTTWKPGAGQTLNRNLLLALPYVSNDKLVFLEDDECYLPGYLKAMADRLEYAPIAGEAPARYYHVGERLYKILRNDAHASLCQTGIRRELFHRLHILCKRIDPFIDLHLWFRGRVAGEVSAFGEAGDGSPMAGVLTKDRHVVSIKGMPGRPGIGIGHRPRGKGWEQDLDLKVLTEWVGEDLAFRYARFYGPANS